MLLSHDLTKLFLLCVTVSFSINAQPIKPIKPIKPWMVDQDNPGRYKGESLDHYQERMKAHQAIINGSLGILTMQFGLDENHAQNYIMYGLIRTIVRDQLYKLPENPFRQHLYTREILNVLQAFEKRSGTDTFDCTYTLIAKEVSNNLRQTIENQEFPIILEKYRPAPSIDEESDVEPDYGDAPIAPPRSRRGAVDVIDLTGDTEDEGSDSEPFIGPKLPPGPDGRRSIASVVPTDESSDDGWGSRREV